MTAHRQRPTTEQEASTARESDHPGAVISQLGFMGVRRDCGQVDAVLGSAFAARVAAVEQHDRHGSVPAAVGTKDPSLVSVQVHLEARP